MEVPDVGSLQKGDKRQEWLWMIGCQDNKRNCCEPEVSPRTIAVLIVFTETTLGTMVGRRGVDCNGSSSGLYSFYSFDNKGKCSNTHLLNVIS